MSLLSYLNGVYSRIFFVWTTLISHMCKWVYSHITSMCKWVISMCKWVICVNESTRITHLCKWVYSHMNESTLVSQTILLSYLTCEWVYSHLSYVRCVNESTLACVTHMNQSTHINYACPYMGWLRWVGCLKIYVSLQNIGLFCRSLLQKWPIFLSILLIVATPYV